jgi:TPR repeat protein
MPFEGDVAIWELRTRLTSAPDLSPEPVLSRARGAELTWVGRLTWIVLLAVGGALTLLWLSPRHGDAPGHSVDLISYEQPASPDVQVAAASTKSDLARAPQSTMPLPRAVDLLLRPTTENERHPGRDLTTGATSPAAGSHAARPSETRMTPPAVVVPSFGEAIPDVNTIAALVARGRKYFAAGDVAAARLVLRPAALAGDPVAALALGESYDPVVLKRLGVIGLSGDPTQARDWYRKAAELGSTDAPLRLEQLAHQLDP